MEMIDRNCPHCQRLNKEATSRGIANDGRHLFKCGYCDRQFKEEAADDLQKSASDALNKRVQSDADVLSKVLAFSPNEMAQWDPPLKKQVREQLTAGIGRAKELFAKSLNDFTVTSYISAAESVLTLLSEDVAASAHALVKAMHNRGGVPAMLFLNPDMAKASSQSDDPIVKLIRESHSRPIDESKIGRR